MALVVVFDVRLTGAVTGLTPHLPTWRSGVRRLPVVRATQALGEIGVAGRAR
jgi:hypothetical protein